MKASHFSPDIIEFIYLLAKHQVEYLIVGGEAVIYHGHTRLTGDVDFFYKASQENVIRLYQALNEFWENDIPGLQDSKELLEPGIIIQFGVPPNRIDLVSRIDNVFFDEAWANRIIEKITSKKRTFPLYLIGLSELIKNKSSLNRPKDQEDLKFLKQLS